MVLLVMLAGWSRGLADLSAAEKNQKPNIVVILADDYGWGSVGCYGGKGLQTPNLDRLAREGRMFKHAYASGSVCSPTRYALMTGRYYWRTSVKDGKVLSGSAPLHIETNRTTLASLCKSQGYRAAVIGKWHLGLGTNDKVDWNAPLKPGPLAVGFDYFYGLSANYGNQPNAYVENEQLLGRIPGQAVELDGEGKEGKTVGIKDQRVDDEVMSRLTDKCVDWIGQNCKSPFFLYYAPVAVHEPITPSAKFTGSQFGKYGDFIHELDWSVGQLLAALDKCRVADNTLVIFTSDNGGVAQLKNPNAGAAMKAGLAINGILRGGKHDIYEGGFREPFLVRWPGKVPAGTVCDDIVSATDVLATLAGVLNTTVPKGSGEDSFDVSTSFFGTTKGKPVRDYVVLQDAQANYAIRQGQWKLIERENAPPVPLRNSKVARVQARKDSGMKDELYSMTTDPSEKENVADKQPEVVKRLRKLLSQTRDQGFSPAPSR